MQSDLISRKALVKAILEERDKIFDTYCSTQLERYGQSMRGGIRRALRCVETAPAVDAVEVVRCEECAYQGRCTYEAVFRASGFENPYCCAGWRKEKKDAVD